MTTSGRWSEGGICSAFTFGSVTETPVASIGAVIMNTTRSTSITSTIGVTLMSAIGLRRLPRPPDPLISIAMIRHPAVHASGATGAR